MSEPTWQRYLADHMQGVRTAFPTTEIVHNAIWFAGDTTADQLRVHRAASLINLERGVNDPGLTGGTGKWSLQALLAFIDHRQAEGHGGRLRRHLDHRRRPPLRPRRLLPDLLGPRRARQRPGRHAHRLVDRAMTLTSAPRSPDRYSWNGVLRRDFEGGYTLVNEPGAPTRTLTLRPAPAISPAPRKTA